jgi:hypothetical protein
MSSGLRIHLTEAQAEQMADRIIMTLLNTDRAYNHAEDAETQAEREDEIGISVWKSLEEKYEIA